MENYFLPSFPLLRLRVSPMARINAIRAVCFRDGRAFPFIAGSGERIASALRAARIAEQADPPLSVPVPLPADDSGEVSDGVASHGVASAAEGAATVVDASPGPPPELLAPPSIGAQPAPAAAAPPYPPLPDRAPPPVLAVSAIARLTKAGRGWRLAQVSSSLRTSRPGVGAEEQVRPRHWDGREGRAARPRGCPDRVGGRREGAVAACRALQVWGAPSLVVPQRKLSLLWSERWAH